MNSIVIYCSHTGTTEKIAKKIGRDTGSTLVKVEPDILYGNFIQTVRRVIADHRKGIVPGYVTDIPDLEGVDTVRQQIGIACSKGGIDPDDDELILERFEVVRHE